MYDLRERLDEGALHARYGGVDVVGEPIVPYVLEKVARVGQALDDAVHEACVADVLEPVQALVLDAAHSVVRPLIVVCNRGGALHRRRY